MLGDVWEGGGRARAFPPSVWRFLTKAERPERPGETVRAGLLAEWRGNPRVAGVDAGNQRMRALLFGTGGRYSPEDLQLRDALFDLLRARIWLMNQDLQLLFHEVAVLAEGASEGAARGSAFPSGP